MWTRTCLGPGLGTSTVLSVRLASEDAVEGIVHARAVVGMVLVVMVVLNWGDGEAGLFRAVGRCQGM